MSNKSSSFFVIILLITLTNPKTALALPSVEKPSQLETFSPEEELAYNLGVQAFIYGFGPMTVAKIRQATTSVSQPMNNATAPLNLMGKTIRLLGPKDKIVPTLNNDTLYSQAHINLTVSGPMVMEVPVTKKRYFIVQLLDAYSESIEDLVASNIGTTGGRYLLVPPNWKGSKPKGIDRVIKSRTPYVWYIHRTGVGMDDDLEGALKVHSKFTIYPLTQKKLQHAQVLAKTTEGIPEMIKPQGLEWFKLIDLQIRNNPLPNESSITEQFKLIGIGGSSHFDKNKLSKAQRKGLLRAIENAPKIIEYASRQLGEKNNGWAMMFQGGRYGNDYLSRASINYRAAGLNVAERALYPNRYTDDKGEQLSGEFRYKMLMPANVPAKEFWSLTLYDAKNLYMVENEINRYAISTNRKGQLTFNDDDSLTVCISHKRPQESCNWLPAPSGDFYLHMRLYEPTQSVLNNEYLLPKVIKY